MEDPKPEGINTTEKTTKDPQGWAEWLERKIKPWQFLLGLLCGIASSFMWATARIEKSAQDTVLNPAFLSRLAGELRPTCIFDANGSILSSSGGQEYVDNIQVEKRTNDWQIALKFAFNRLVSNEPLVTSLDGQMWRIKAQRVPQTKYDWEILLETRVPWDLGRPHQFKLEIVR